MKYLGPIQKCEQYRGIQHPDKQYYCCPKECKKFCGAKNCYSGPVSGCCSSLKANHCGSEFAPCVLGN